MPARVEGHRWRLAYSHDEHGYSLNTLYRNMCEFDSATLVVVQDNQDNVSLVLTIDLPMFVNSIIVFKSMVITDLFFHTPFWRGREFEESPIN